MRRRIPPFWRPCRKRLVKDFKNFKKCSKCSKFFKNHEVIPSIEVFHAEKKNRTKMSQQPFHLPYDHAAARLVKMWVWCACTLFPLLDCLMKSLDTHFTDPIKVSILRTHSMAAAQCLSEFNCSSLVEGYLVHQSTHHQKLSARHKIACFQGLLRNSEYPF